MAEGYWIQRKPQACFELHGAVSSLCSDKASDRSKVRRKGFILAGTYLAGHRVCSQGSEAPLFIRSGIPLLMVLKTHSQGGSSFSI